MDHGVRAGVRLLFDDGAHLLVEQVREIPQILLQEHSLPLFALLIGEQHLLMIINDVSQLLGFLQTLFSTFLIGCAVALLLSGVLV